jgi:hypothetical protein
VPCPGPERPGLPDLRLAREPLAEAEHAILELAALLDAEVSVTEIILQALEARIVGLKKVVGLLIAGWVRGCARLRVVHSGFLSVGRVPRSGNSCGAIFMPTDTVSAMLFFVKLCCIISA